MLLHFQNIQTLIQFEINNNNLFTTNSDAHNFNSINRIQVTLTKQTLSSTLNGVLNYNGITITYLIKVPDNIKQLKDKITSALVEN